MKDLISVFEDTEKYSENMIPSETSKNNFSKINKVLSFTSNSKKWKPVNNIRVINTDSVSAVSKYHTIGKTCVLNMASYKRPGGGVRNGAKAQEECLFRCSNLIHSISVHLYPLKINEALYTKNVTFFKDYNYEYMDNAISDVITIAAINLNTEATETPKKMDYEKITKDKIRLMLSLSIDNQVDNLILGAFGCGVFKNDPNIISKYFHDILVGEGYANYFDNIIFAIINDNNSVGNNYNIFKEIFNK